MNTSKHQTVLEISEEDSKMDQKSKKAFSKIIRHLLLPQKSRHAAQKAARLSQGESPKSKLFSPSVPPASLLGCPGEIRNQIYHYLFDDPSTENRLRSLQSDGAINPNTHVLLVCRQIYEEARNIARPNFLLVPKHEFFKCVDGLTLPINFHHMARISQGPTDPEQIRCLILREYLHNLIMYWKAPQGEPPLSMKLKVETVFVQLCICEAMTWILGGQDDLISKYGDALIQFLETYPSVSRVVTYFCGLEGNFRCSWYSTIHIQANLPVLIAASLSHIASDSLMEGAEWLPRWDVHPQPGSKITQESWMLTAQPVLDLTPRRVQIDFFNSSTHCGKKCVLE